MNKIIKTVLFILVLAVSTSVFAQSAGVGDFGSAFAVANSQLKGIRDQVITGTMIVGGIVCIVGAVRAGYKFWNNEHESIKGVMLWVGGCLFFWLAYTVSTSMFR